MNVNGSALHDELARTVTRWPAAAGAKVGAFTRQKLGDLAQVESRRLLATAQVELANRAIWRFAELLFDDAGGRRWNVARDGRILIPTPWSSTRHADYGLTDHGRRILRRAITDHLAHLPPSNRWLLYAEGRWHLSRRYTTLEAVKAWMGEYALTPAMWAAAADATPRRGRKG